MRSNKNNDHSLEALARRYRAISPPPDLYRRILRAAKAQQTPATEWPRWAYAMALSLCILTASFISLYLQENVQNHSAVSAGNIMPSFPSRFSPIFVTTPDIPSSPPVNSQPSLWKVAALPPPPQPPDAQPAMPGMPSSKITVNLN